MPRELKITGAPVYLGFGDVQTALLPPEHRNQFQFTELLPGTVANLLTLTHDDLLANLSKVQQANGVEPDSGLAYIEETIETAAGQKPVRFPNFSV